MNEKQTDLVIREPMQVERPAPSAISILEAAVKGGITAENVAVVERLAALCRVERDDRAKEGFAKAFFALRKKIASLEIYADKAARDNSGKVAYRYCSETELTSQLDPVLIRHGFTTMFGQRQEDGKTVAIITLMHESGHQENREFSVRSGNTNAMKDATAADSGATTTAWRHLAMKLFGLKSRIREDDARLLGQNITKAQADDLRRRVMDTGSDEADFLSYAQAKTFESIQTGMYAALDSALRRKENTKV